MLKHIAVCLLFLGSTAASEDFLSSMPAEFVVKATIDDVNAVFKTTIRNNSDNTIFIKDIRGGCGCIKTEIDNRRLPPHGTATLDVIFEFKDYSGPQNRKLRIVYIPEASKDPKDEQSYSIPLTGVIPTGLSFSTKALAWFDQDKPDAKKLEIKYTDEVDAESIHVEGLDSSPHLIVTQTNTIDKRTLFVEVAPKTTTISELSPTEGKELQQGYIVRYTTKEKKVVRYERFYTAILKRPGKDDVFKDVPSDQHKLGLIATWVQSNTPDGSHYQLVLQHGLTYELTKAVKEPTDVPFSSKGTFAFYGDSKALVLSPARAATDTSDPPMIIFKYLVSNRKESLTGDIKGASVILAKP